MGCGSSSLKGEKVDGLSGDGRPARRVQTNFSDVDFDRGAAADRRGTMAVAPDEQRRPTKISESSVDGAPDAPIEPTTVNRSEQESAPISELQPKAQATPEIQFDGAPSNEEAAALATVSNPTVPPAKA